MTQTFSSEQAVELAVLERNGFIESRHLGAAVVTEPDGAPAIVLGDGHAPVFARSTLKPFQAIAALGAGAALHDDQVAIAAASHRGSREHMELVAQILASAGLSEEHLQCPVAWPLDRGGYQWLLTTRGGPSRLAMNCSGKHAAFLLACLANSWDRASYVHPRHPLQQRVLATIQEYTSQEPFATGIDGCGAPVVALSLTALARAYGRLGRSACDLQADARAASVATAMVDYPWAVEGPGKPNTVVMERLGVLAKLGAEGVLALATTGGYGVAVKVLDGSGRAATAVGLSLLVAAGVLAAEPVAEVIERVTEPVTGGGRIVGGIQLGSAVARLLPRGAPERELL